MSNSQIEELRKKWEDNNISYYEIGQIFNIMDQLEKHFDETVKRLRTYNGEIENKIEEIEPLKEVVKLQHEAIKILIER